MTKKNIEKKRAERPQKGGRGGKRLADTGGRSAGGRDSERQTHRKTKRSKRDR